MQGELVTDSLQRVCQYLLRFIVCFTRVVKRKIVPVKIILRPLTLAVWFMDDGSRSWNSFYLNSQKFDLQSQNNLMRALERLKITSSLHKDKEYLRLHINNKGSIRFKKLVEPYVIASMRYKLLI